MSNADASAEPITAFCSRPVARPVMLQGWRNLASAHWPVDPALVQRLLPPAFRVDTFDGAAWVGLIPFHMERIRLPHLPPFGGLSTFPETNVRTYIIDPNGRRGVWFLSLDITRLAPTLVARVSYHLPYCWSFMSIDRAGDRVEYRSDRRWPRGTARSRLVVRVGNAIEPNDISDLQHFVTARWSLGSTYLGRPLWADVDHEPWPLHRVTVEDVDASVITACGLPKPTGEPIALWSPGVEVRIGRPRLLRRAA